MIWVMVVFQLEEIISEEREFTVNEMPSMNARYFYFW